MKGKILGAGAISGDDGKRYYYNENELKNRKEGQNIEGLEVDFEVIEGKAVGVYITSKPSFSSNFNTFNVSVANLPSIDTKFVFLDFNAIKTHIFAPHIHSIKFFAILTLACVLITNLLFESYISQQHSGGAGAVFFYIFGILSLLFGLWVNYCLLQTSHDKKPLVYFTSCVIVSVIMGILLKTLVGDLMMSLFGGKPPYFKMAFICFLFITYALLTFLWFSRVGKVLNEKFFIYSLYVQLLGYLCLVIMAIMLLCQAEFMIWYDFALICNIASSALLTIAWLKFRTIHSIA